MPQVAPDSGKGAVAADGVRISPRTTLLQPPSQHTYRASGQASRARPKIKTEGLNPYRRPVASICQAVRGTRQHRQATVSQECLGSGWPTCSGVSASGTSAPALTEPSTAHTPVTVLRLISPSGQARRYRSKCWPSGVHGVSGPVPQNPHHTVTATGLVMMTATTPRTRRPGMPPHRRAA
jgi:hypothetical protein